MCLTSPRNSGSDPEMYRGVRVVVYDPQYLNQELIFVISGGTLLYWRHFSTQGAGSTMKVSLFAGD
jgi:hypothetical protein